MSIIVFFIKKETNAFHCYSIIENKTIRQTQREIDPYNETHPILRAYIVNDDHVIAAILSKEKIKTDFKNQVIKQIDTCIAGIKKDASDTIWVDDSDCKDRPETVVDCLEGIKEDLIKKENEWL